MLHADHSSQKILINHKKKKLQSPYQTVVEDSISTDAHITSTNSPPSLPTHVPLNPGTSSSNGYLLNVENYTYKSHQLLPSSHLIVLISNLTVNFK